MRGMGSGIPVGTTMGCGYKCRNCYLLEHLYTSLFLGNGSPVGKLLGSEVAGVTVGCVKMRGKTTEV